MEHDRRWLTLLMALLLWLVAMPVAAQRGSTALMGQSFVLESGQTLDGDVAVFAGSVQIAADALVTGDVAVIGGSVRIDGTVQGDATVLGGSMTLGPRAWVRGDVVAIGSLTRDPGARVDGSVVAGAERSRELEEVRQSLQERSALPSLTPLPGGVNARFWSVLRWLAGVLGIMVLAVAVAAILPEASQHIGEVMERSALLSVAVGVLTVLAAGLVTPLLIVIVVGIPVAIVLVIALGLALLVGYAAAARLVGQKLLGLLKISAPNALLDVVAGVVALALLGRIPCLGALVSLAAVCWGLGAVVLTRFGTSQGLIWAPFEPLAATAGMARQPPPEAPAGAEDTERSSDTKPLSPRDLRDESVR